MKQMFDIMGKKKMNNKINNKPDKENISPTYLKAFISQLTNEEIIKIKDYISALENQHNPKPS